MFNIRAEQIGSMRRTRLGDSFIEGFAGTKQTAAWEPSSEDISVTDPLGNKTSLSFDHNGFPTSVVTPTGRHFEFRNNSIGQPQELTTPSGLLVQIEYDDKQRLRSVARDGTFYLGVEYDSITQQPSRVQTPTGPAIQLDYFSPQHLAGVTDRMGRRTSLEYGARSELTALIDAAGNRTDFEYGQWDLAERIRYADGSVEERQFDERGRLTASRIGGVGLMKVNYDDANRPKEQTYTDGEVVTFDYDDAGRLTTVTNSQSVVSFIYDGDGRQIREEVNGVVVRYDYNECGFLAGLTYPTGERVSFRRDAEQRVTDVTDWSGGVHLLRYASGDGGHSHVRPNGVIEYVAKDRCEFPRRIIAEAPNGDGQLFTTDFEFSNEDNLVAVTDSVFGHFSCEYDLESRLTAVRSDRGSNEIFTYDDVDNRTSRNDVLSTYSSVNQLLQQGRTTWRYDDRGNLISKFGPDGVWQYEWNARNQLVRVHTPTQILIEFVYDGLGRRLWKRVGMTTVRYTWALESLIEEETTERSAKSLRQYLYWPFTTIALGMRCDGQDYQIHTDHLGAPQRMTDAAGHVVWDRRPCPSGEFEVRIQEVPLALRYPGQMLDQETGLYYNRHRYYSPEQGRYISRDPASFSGGINLYCYSENNPTSNADPLGLWTADGVLSVVGKTCGVIAGVAAGIAIAVALPGPAGIILGGAVAGAIINGSFYLMDNSSKPMCWPCFGKSLLTGAIVGAAAAVPFVFLPAGAGVAAFAGVGALSGAIGYTGSWLFSPPGTPWSWKGFGASVALGAATAGLGRYFAPQIAGALQKAGIELPPDWLPASGARDVPPPDPEIVAKTGEPSAATTNRTSEHPYQNPDNMQTVKPGQPLDVNGLDPNKKYLWVVDPDGNVRIAPEDQPGLGRPLKHGDLTPGPDGTSRGPARSGGELKYNPKTGHWEMNNDSSYTFARQDGQHLDGDNLNAAHDLLTKSGTDTSNIDTVNSHGSDAKGH